MDSQKSDPFYEELRDLINKYSKENGSDTPDFVLADYLTSCLENFNYAVRYRESTKPSQVSAQVSKERLKAYKSGYEQGRFDKEMNTKYPEPKTALHKQSRPMKGGA